MFGSPLHWGAKGLSLIVGLVLAAAAVISLVDGDDVLGIFAANGRTTLVWAIAAAVLIVLALLPRVGGGSNDGPDERFRREERARRHATADRTAAASPRPTATENTTEETMEIPKDKVLDLLRSRARTTRSTRPQQELPDQVDPEQHAGLLQKFGLDPQDLIGKLGGGVPGL